MFVSQHFVYERGTLIVPIIAPNRRNRPISGMGFQTCCWVYYWSINSICKKILNYYHIYFHFANGAFVFSKFD